MKKAFLLLVVLCFCLQLHAQQYEVVNGKKMIVHTVVKGNTLYSIAREYNVNMSDILNQNPEAEKGLNIGQKLYIVPPLSQTDVEPTEKHETPTKTPVAKSTDNPFDGSIRLNKFHVAVKGESLYSIAREYGVNMYDIVKLNPGIEDGIRLGQKIIIPDADNHAQNSNSVDIVYYDTVVKHKIQKSETLYSISKRYMVSQKEIAAYNGLKNSAIQPDSTLLVPLKKEDFENVAIRKVPNVGITMAKKVANNEFVYRQKDRYKIVLSLPLGLSNPNEKYARIATEFYIGAEYALDSLQKQGLNADVFVLDCAVDSATYHRELSKHKDADLIIGPFLGERAKITAVFCKNNKIKMVNPISGYEKNLIDNPYVVNAMTADLTLMEGMASYLIKTADQKRLILVKPLEKDMALYNAFRNKLEKEATATKTKFIECSLSEIPTYFQKGVDVSIVYSSRDQNEVIKFMNVIYKNMAKVGSGNIDVYGTKEWISMDKVKDYYKNTFHLHFGMANDFDYNYPQTIQLLKAVRNKYNVDLTKFTAQGFDVIYYFISKDMLNKTPSKLIMNDFNLVEDGTGNGFINTTTYVYEQRDFNYVLLESFK